MTTGRRAALRVARRTAWRNRKRTFFLVAMIGVPVALAVVVAGAIRASELTPEEGAQFAFGDADYRINGAYSAELEPWVAMELADLDPESEWTLYHDAYGRIGGGGYARVTDVDVVDPMGSSVLSLLEGEAPADDGEIALSPALAGALDLEIGDTTEMAVLTDDPATYRVVGMVTPPLVRNEPLALITPSRWTTLIEAAGNVERSNASSQWLVASESADETAVALSEAWFEHQSAFWPDTAVKPQPEALRALELNLYVQLDQEQVDALMAMDIQVDEETGQGVEALYQAALEMVGESGYEPISIPYLNVDLRSSYELDFGGDVTSSPPVIATGVAALLLAEVAFVAGAAFAAGTRRRLREIGLLGANGADVKQIRLTVIGEGLTVGLVGGIAGVATGVLILILGRPIMQRFVPFVMSGVDLYAWDVVGPLLVAVISTVVAAWLPARTASRVPTTTALQGRMPARAPRPWVAPLGLGLAAFGGLLLLVALTAAGTTATSAVAVIGSLLMVGGVALLAGPIVALVSRIADQLKSTPRLVLRDSGRHRTRASVAVAATMVILIAPALAMLFQVTEAERSLLHGLPTPADQVVLAGGFDDLGNQTSITDADVTTVAGLVPEDRVARFTRLNVGVVLEAESVPTTDDVNGGYFDESGELILGTPNWGAMLANPDLMDVLGGDELARALDDTGVVILGVEDRASWVLIDGERHDARELPVPVMWSIPRVIVSQSVMESFGEVERLDAVIFHLARQMTSEERNELFFGNLEIYGGWSDLSTTEIFLIAIGATLIAVLIVVALVTAVAAAEIKEEMEVIVAVGAPGSIRRRFLGIQTWLYTTIAAVLAIPLAVGAMKILALAQGGSYGGPFGTMASSQIVIPWLGIGFLVLALPMIVGLLTTLATRSAPVTPPRRAS